MQEEKKSEDPRLGDLIKPGIDGDIVIIGYPHDLGAQRAGKPYGQEYGPDCWRRFLPKSGPLFNAEYDIDISQLKITDYGNIECSEEYTLENIQKKLVKKISKIVSSKRLPFIVGGTKDQVYGCIKGIIDSENIQKQTVGIISIQKYTDINSLHKEDQIHQDCAIKKILVEYKTPSILIHYFGTEKYDNGVETHKFKNEYKEILSFTHYDEIKKTTAEPNKNLGEPITPGGIKYLEKLKEFIQKCDVIHLSISLEAMNHADCPGVATKNKQGFSAEEMLEIMYLSGLERKIISVDISDYCPKFEDFRTGNLISNLFYYFVMAYSIRLSS